MRPFSNGTEFVDWHGNNCKKCKFQGKCKLEHAPYRAYYGNGEITFDEARRLGVKTDTYKWFCKGWIYRKERGK